MTFARSTFSSISHGTKSPKKTPKNQVATQTQTRQHKLLILFFKGTMEQKRKQTYNGGMKKEGIREKIRN